MMHRRWDAMVPATIWITDFTDACLRNRLNKRCRNELSGHRNTHPHSTWALQQPKYPDPTNHQGLHFNNDPLLGPAALRLRGVDQ